MNQSPAANYYRPTEEPEPLDLTQLNVEASVMCLVSKIKFLCGRSGSPAIRLRQPKKELLTEKVVGNKNEPEVEDKTSVKPFPDTGIDDQNTEVNGNNLNGSNETDDKPVDGVEKNRTLNNVASTAENTLTPPSRMKRGNKFTDGLDLSLTTDWASELRPSMKKLRQAMDGLLKTARLMHSVQRLQQDSKKASSILTVTYRRDVCFSQAVSLGSK